MNRLLDGVAIERVPTKIPSAVCSIKTAYIPVLTIGMAQQQYSRAFMVVEMLRAGASDRHGHRR